MIIHCITGFMNSRINDFKHKLFNWEYWPFGIIYLPVIFYWLWKSIKARSLFFFSASNPSIDTGGFLGESKWHILQNIPNEFIPSTIFLKPDTPFEVISSQLISSRISYPLIVKPDMGERGRLVEKVKSAEELKKYTRSINLPFLIQEYVDLPIELGIFYYRFPGQEKGIISSIVQKEFLKLTGDGTSSVEELAEKIPRARFQINRLFRKDPSLQSRILQPGEILELEPIGNHCRGTAFIDGSKYIDCQLTAVIDELAKKIKGFYYGRFDLRCSTMEELKKGKNFKILELNGAGSEPGHIYDPEFSIFSAWKVLLSHWDVLYQISLENHANGIPFMTFPEVIKKISEIRKRQDLESF